MAQQHLLTRDIFERALTGNSKEGIELILSPKKSATAFSSYNIPDSDEIFLLVDFTRLGSATDGVALTSSGIYWHDTSRKKGEQIYPEHGISWDEIDHYSFTIKGNLLSIGEFYIKLEEKCTPLNLLNIIDDIAQCFKISIKRNDRRKKYILKLSKQIISQKIQGKNFTCMQTDFDQNTINELSEAYRLPYGDEIFLSIENKKLKFISGRIILTSFGIFWNTGDKYPKEGIRWDDIQEYDYYADKDDNKLGVGNSYSISFPDSFPVLFFLNLLIDISDYFKVSLIIINNLVPR